MLPYINKVVYTVTSVKFLPLIISLGSLISLIIPSGLFHTGWKWGYTHYVHTHGGWIQHVLYMSESCTYTSSRIRYVLCVSDLVLKNKWQMLCESREIWAWDAKPPQAYRCSSKIFSKFVAPSEKLLPICSAWLSQQTKPSFCYAQTKLSDGTKWTTWRKLVAHP